VYIFELKITLYVQYTYIHMDSFVWPRDPHRIN